MPEALLIRADGNARIGTGHVMRCLALAQGWQRAGGVAVFACAEITPALESRLVAEGFPVRRLKATTGTVEDAEQTILLARSLQSAVFNPQSSTRWLVADGYHFDTAYQRAIKDVGLRLMLVDDYGHAEHYCADLVLNQNLNADANLYRSREPYTRLLLGTQYVLLRQQFLAYRDWQREIPAVARKVLVTLGGADPDNVTGKVIEALRGLDLEAKIVVGGSNPHLPELRSQVSAFSLLTDVQNMPELMAWADVAVSSGGTTVWELAYMGLPSVIGAISHAERSAVSGLDRINLFEQIGWFSTRTRKQIVEALAGLLRDRARRVQMSNQARTVVDGQGCRRVNEALRGTKETA